MMEMMHVFYEALINMKDHDEQEIESLTNIHDVCI